MNENDQMEAIAKAIYTGILYGGNEEGWAELPEATEGLYNLSLDKRLLRCVAQDVIYGLAESGYIIERDLMAF